MKEAMSHVLHSSLEWDDSEHERAVDKLTAFSYSERFATLLWRFKYANDSSAYKPIIYMLARSLKLSRSVAVKVAEQALHEWIFSFCPVCLGAKETMAGELRVVCPSCDGSGVARFSDKEREAKLGLNFGRHVDALLRIISGSDMKPSAEMRRRLLK